jgi:isopenicillin N synthase-like dioxygenase
VTAPRSRAQLPLLDIAAFRAGDRLDGGASFVSELRAACHGPGFFLITGHGIDPALCAAVLDVSREFFALPDADKLAIENVRSPQFRGYSRVGAEHTNGRPDRREQLDLGEEHAPREPGPGEPPYWRLQGPNQWPPALPRLREVLLPFIGAMQGLALDLMRAFARSLGQPEDHFDPTFAVDPTPHLKVIRYPGRPADADADIDRTGPGAATQGVGAHKDYGYLAILLQDDAGGLQVADATGSGGGGRTGFVDEVPVEGALVCNIGEMFEVATRGYYRATVHRVLSPPPGHERVSVPYFFAPRLDARLEPLTLPDALAAEIPAPAPPDPDNPIFAEFGTNALKGWLRSHPEVARRHWSDLVPTV